MIIPFRRTSIPVVLAAFLVATFLPGAGAFPSPAAADDDRAVTADLPPSNTALLARASGAVARRLAQQTPLTPGTRVGLRQEGGTKLDTDMREALLQAFNARRITCVLLEPVGVSEEPAAAPAADAAPAEPAAPAPATGSLAELLPQAQASQAAGQTEYDRLQAERVAQEARADSIRTARGAPGGTSGASGGPAASAVAVPGNIPVLTFRVQEARVDYVRQFRSGIFGSQRVERRARSDLALRLTPAGSEGVAWSASADTALGDVVLKSELAGLEDRTRPETRPVLPQNNFKKVLEPVLVVVLVAGLVSLFYQNRP